MDFGRTPQKNSPNDCFARHGYHVHRYKNKSGGVSRIIVSPEGELELVNPSYEVCMQLCKDRNLVN